ncbi:site-specific DNA-methyltransferase [Xanthomonas campestris pv. raphani]|uniref:site-specific DNA-methyltransferase n=1 Tax=Xanthomonas campestris TaxID=339 RepID=UPI002B224E81|nr:site-specific DNA-methyltransferase [Xanthomonas campestris]MEA9750759.1 site-specific DNA-methyltransferase [Xanthomonas campestris pv. raphani]MEA9813039.1 site-specific DNA-methyltransferase [Xanthomonas campestris pv. raphani]MEA9914314.1 site-specific DNA-methyltransferase [Xanthomonas campestris pv. raphani]
MDKLKMHSPDLVDSSIARIRELFPGCVTEARGEDGSVKLAVDFDQLRQELTDVIVEGPQERYQLNWPGKREALLTANAPIAKTLRPCRDESVDFDTTKNLFIEGDNLDALKLLQETYLGKIKLIYIDPPYNTGNDFIYADSFAATIDEELKRSGQISVEGIPLVANTTANGRFHSDWLSMLFPRLRLARNLLVDEGVLVVSIDENEHANLVTIGSEIFGRDAYVGELVLKNSSKNDQGYISIQHEYIVFFVKNRAANTGEWTERKEGLEKIYAAFDGFRKRFGDDWLGINAAAKDWYKKFPASDPVYGSKHYNWMDENGVYFASDISGPNDGQYVYDVEHPVTKLPCKRPARGWVFPPESMREKINQGRVHFGPDHTTVPKLKTYLKDTETQSITSIRYVDGRAASKRLATLFGEKVFTNPKDEILLRDIYRAIGVEDGDVILDMFSGSGSALHAVWELNHAGGKDVRFIGIQIAEDLNKSLKSAKGAAKQITTNAIRLLTEAGKPATVSEIGKQRLRLIGERLRAGANWLDVGFRFLKTDTSNLTDVYYAPDVLDRTNLDLFVDNIKPDRTPEDLLFQVMLDWGVDLALPIETKAILGKDVFFVDGDALAACFDAQGGIDEAFVKELANYKPLRVVFRDAGFKDSAVKINVEQIFKLLSPITEVKSI